MGLGPPLTVLREASSAGKSCTLSFYTPAGVGAVWVRKGHMVDAALGGLRGERALLQIASYGAARWSEEGGPDSGRQTLHLEAAELERKVGARQRQWSELLTTLPPLSAVLSPEALVAPLEGARAEVYASIDGKKPLFEVLDESDLDPVATLGCIKQLLDCGAIRSSEPLAPDDLVCEPASSHGVRAFERLQEAPAETAIAVQRWTQPVVPPPPPARGGPVLGPDSAPEARLAPDETGPSEASPGAEAAPGIGAAERLRPVLGRYEILERIGRGGMATVYLCRLEGEGGFSRRFALKVLREHLCRSPEAVQMLLREARLTGRLHHPNVVSVIDVGNDRGQPYLVMEYVPGCSVAELIAAETRGDVTVPPRAGAAIVIETLAGLHAAHTLGDERGRVLGLVHQDVSPENLLVGFDGVTRVTDFGVAHVSEPLAGVTQQRGKPQYLAPERITTGEVDHRADIFAAGVVLYRLLTGLDLFEGETADDVMQEVLYKPIAPPSTVGRGPHPVFDAVCLRALERDRERRYRSAEHFRAELLRAAVLVDQLALPSDVAELSKRAAAALRPAGSPAVEGARPPEEERDTAPDPGQAIVLARRPQEKAPDTPRAATQVLARPKASEPLPTWAVAVFLVLSLGLALALDALSGSEPDVPTLPPDSSEPRPVLETQDLRIDLGDDTDEPEPVPERREWDPDPELPPEPARAD